MTVVCSCGKTLQLPDALAGHEVTCPFCRAAVKTPAPAPASDDPAASLIQALKNQPVAAPVQDEHVAALSAAIQRSAPGNQPPDAKPVPAPPLPVPAPASVQRFPISYYVVGSAIVFILLVAIIIVANSSQESNPAKVSITVSPAPPPEHHVAAQPETQAEAPSTDTGPGLFGNVPSGDSKDYEKRTGKKADSLK